MNRPLLGMLPLMSVGVCVLSACASFSLSSPSPGTVASAPMATALVPFAVAVDANPRMSLLRVLVDGTDVTGQMNLSPDDKKAQGTVNLGVGKHTISATATVPCWHCFPTQYQASADSGVCVAPPGSPAVQYQKAFTDATNNLSWANLNDSTVSIATDNGSLDRRWRMNRFGPILSIQGTIHSISNDCLCMSSVDDQQNTPVGLRICDPNDLTQRWEAHVVLPAGSYELMNLGRNYKVACITEGSAGTLVQRTCDNSAEQSWIFRDSFTTQLGGLPFQ